MDNAACIRGSLFWVAIQTMRNMASPEQWQQTLALLSKETRALVESERPLTDWTPVRHPDELRGIGFKTVFNEQPSQLFAYGLRIFIADNRFFSRMLLRMISFETARARGRAMWAHNYRHCGVSDIERVDGHAVRTKYTANPMGSAIYWEVVRGYLSAVWSTWSGVELEAVNPAPKTVGPDCTFIIELPEKLRYYLTR